MYVWLDGFPCQLEITMTKDQYSSIVYVFFFLKVTFIYFWASLMAQLVKNPPAMQVTWFQGSIPRLGRSPGEGKSYPLQWSYPLWPGEFHGLKSPLGRKSRWATLTILFLTTMKDRYSHFTNDKSKTQRDQLMVRTMKKVSDKTGIHTYSSLVVLVWGETDMGH